VFRAMTTGCRAPDPRDRGRYKESSHTTAFRGSWGRGRIRVVDVFVAWWSDGHEIETARALDEVEAKHVIEHLKSGVRWTVFEREHTRWHVRAAGVTEPHSISFF
jgi:hypothetical protein